MATGPEDELRAATARHKAAQKRAEQARDEQRRAIVRALDSGMRQVDVVAITGYTREHIRRITDAVRKSEDV